MKAVKPKDVVDALYEINHESYKRLKKGGHTGAAINFSEFEAAMLKSGLLCDPATIRAKWRALLSLEVIRLVKPSEMYGRAVVDFETFELYHIIPVLPETKGEIDREIERDVCAPGEGF